MIGGTANQVQVPEGVSLDRGQRDVPTDLLGAAKVTVWRCPLWRAWCRRGRSAVVGEELPDTPVEVTGDGRDFGGGG